MKHILLENKKNKRTYAACKVMLTVELRNEAVIAALESDCDACRTAVGVASVNEKSWSGQKFGITKSPNRVPQPYADLEPLESIRKRRDGR